MYKITLEKETDGLAFKNSFWNGEKSLEIYPVTVLTGNNGSGKTAIINAIMRGAGGIIEVSSLEESASYEGIGLGYGKEFGKIKNSYLPDEVFYHNAVFQTAGRGWVDCELDTTRIFAKRQSHGEFLQCMLQRHWELHIKNKHRICLSLIDEIETGLSCETLRSTVAFLGILTEWIMEQAHKDQKPRIALIISTQNPEVVFELVSKGALRIDLGGWKNGDPFAKCLEGLVK